ncbi:MAG: alpha/beta hydrolase, partial [Verrucomicrobiota bacterium]
LLVHGDQDTVVPLEPNSGALVEGYATAGRAGLARLIVLPGRGHDMDLGFFRSGELVQFAVERARAGR